MWPASQSFRTCLGTPWADLEACVDGWVHGCRGAAACMGVLMRAPPTHGLQRTKSPPQIKKMISDIDTDGSGTIDFGESPRACAWQHGAACVRAGPECSHPHCLPRSACSVLYVRLTVLHARASMQRSSSR